MKNRKGHPNTSQAISVKMKRTVFPLPPRPQVGGPMFVPPPQPQRKMRSKPSSISFPTKKNFEPLKVTQKSHPWLT